MRVVEQPIAEIVQAARGGELRAWERLVEAFQDMAVGLALGRLGDFDAAHEAAQEAFALALERIEQLREPAAFPGWFAAIVRTACSRRLRLADSPSAPVEVLERALAPSEDQPVQIVSRGQETERVRAAVEALPEHERTVIALHYLAELSYPEVARFLGITESAARKRAHSARRRLKETLTMTTDHLAAVRPSRSARFRDEVAIFAAIRRGDHATLRRLLEADPTLTAATESWSWEEGFAAGLPVANEGTPLIRAVQTGDLQAVEILLAAGAPVNARCHCEGAETPLWTAVLTGRDQIMRRLLDAGADVNAISFQGSTPLHAAAQRSPQLMARLIAAGADLRATDARGRTATDWAQLNQRRNPRQDASLAELLPTGIRALDLFAPIRRGDRQYWPPAIKVGQTVVLYELARALTPDDFWWIGFACGPYDRANLEHHSRELGVDGHYRLAAEDLNTTERRHIFSDALAEITATPRPRFIVLLSAPGFQHEVTLALQTLSHHPSVLLTAVVEPQIDAPPVVGAHPPEGYDAQVAFDTRRARRRLFPAIDSERTIANHYPSRRHAQLAQAARALLMDYLRLDPELALPDPTTLPQPTATTAQQLLRYLRQPFEVAEPFHSRPGQSTPYTQLLDHIEQLLPDQ